MIDYFNLNKQYISLYFYFSYNDNMLGELYPKLRDVFENWECLKNMADIINYLPIFKESIPVRNTCVKSIEYQTNSTDFRKFKMFESEIDSNGKCSLSLFTTDSC